MHRFVVDTLRNNQDCMSIVANGYKDASKVAAKSLFGSFSDIECVYDGNGGGSLYRAYARDDEGWSAPLGECYHVARLG